MRKALRLHKETVRALTPDALEEARGGTILTTIATPMINASLKATCEFCTKTQEQSVCKLCQA